MGATRAPAANEASAAWATERELCRRYSCGSRTIKQIAAKFDVNAVRAGKRWRRYDSAAFDAAWHALAEEARHDRGGA